jgi:ubiquinone/menaquinone biosynthesis C-methylase UbiE
LRRRRERRRGGFSPAEEIDAMTQTDFAQPNARQLEEWNDATGRRWLERHESVDRQIAPFGHRAMERAAIRSGEHVLDVGCGCGETALDLARRVGAAGLVLGVDISRLLVEAAIRLARQSGAANLRFAAADAQIHAFPPARFDLIFSRFGIMFFDDPEAAFRNLRSALRPGGRLVFVCWPAPRENLFVTIPLAAAAPRMPLPEPGEPDAPGPFAFADLERVRRILSRAGFEAIETERLTAKVGGGTADEVATMLLELGPLGGMLSSVGEETRNAIVADMRAALGRFESAGRVLLDAVASLVTARRPERGD